MGRAVRVGALCAVRGARDDPILQRVIAVVGHCRTLATGPSLLSLLEGTGEIGSDLVGRRETVESSGAGVRETVELRLGCCPRVFCWGIIMAG